MYILDCFLKGLKMSWQVYIVKTRCEKLYTGISTDVDRRFREHSQMFESKKGKGAKYFLGHEPMCIVYVQSCSSRSIASKIEAQIKRLSVKKKQALVAGFNEGKTLVFDAANI
jgi:putative endonuclease